MRHQYISVAHRKPLLQRFWAKVQKTDGCWLWIGTTNNIGYGLITINQRRKSPLLVHRLSYEMYRGAIPERMCVLHKCDVRNCVQPDHLWIGSHKENTADMIAKGRRPSTLAKYHPHESTNPRATILSNRHDPTPSMLGRNLEIVRRRANAETLDAIGSDFGISRQRVWQILQNKAT